MYRKNNLDLDSCMIYTNSDYKYGKMKSLEVIAIANILDYYKIHKFVNFDKIEQNYFIEKKLGFKTACKTINKIVKDENLKCKIKKHYYISFDKIAKNIDEGFPMLVEYKDLKYGKNTSVIVGYLEEAEDRKIKILTGRDLDSEVLMPWDKECIKKVCTVCI